MLKVLMIARATLFRVKGGDTVQVVETARHLRMMGVQVDIRLTDECIRYERYDLIHFFNLARPADILYHCSRSGIPVVLSPILVDYSNYDKFHRQGLSGWVFRFLSSDDIEYVKTIGRWVLGKDRLMSRAYLWKGQKGSIRNVLSATTLLLPNSLSESQRLLGKYPYKGKLATVVNGIDDNLFKRDPSISREQDLVICVARIEGIKNQLNLIRAINHSGFRLWIIGEHAPNQKSYFEACKKEAGDKVRFLGALSQTELATCYQKASIHALPSWFETTGLSSLEAGAMGCNLVISDRGDTLGYFGEDACYCDPASPESILAAIKLAARKPFPARLHEKIHKEYTWHQAAKQTYSAYINHIPGLC